MPACSISVCIKWGPLQGSGTGIGIQNPSIRGDENWQQNIYHRRCIPDAFQMAALYDAESHDQQGDADWPTHAGIKTSTPRISYRWTIRCILINDFEFTCKRTDKHKWRICYNILFDVISHIFIQEISFTSTWMLDTVTWYKTPFENCQVKNVHS